MYTDSIDGLGKGKGKFKKLLKLKMNIALPGRAMQQKKKAKKKRLVAVSTPMPVVPVIIEPSPMPVAPVVPDPIMRHQGPGEGLVPDPIMRHQGPGEGYADSRARHQGPGKYGEDAGFYVKQLQPQSSTILHEDYFPTSLDYDFEPTENLPMITPYESAVAAVYGSEEDFTDTPAAYESEAGYLEGLGQESGSTGGWFTDIVSQGAKAAIEIRKARVAAKAARSPLLYPGGDYKPYAPAGIGFNMNTILMTAALGLGGFLLYKTLSKKRG